MFTLTLSTIHQANRTSNRKRDINLYDDDDDDDVCVCVFVFGVRVCDERETRFRCVHLSIAQTANYLMYSVYVYYVTVEVKRGMSWIKN